MIQIVIAIIGLLALAGGGWAWLHSHDNAVEAAYQAQIDKAQQEAQAKVDQAFGDAANYIAEEETKRRTAEARASALAAQIRGRGATYVASNPAFGNPQCDVGPDFLRLVNDSTGAMRTAALAERTPSAVPPAGPAAGRQDGDGSAGAARGPESGGGVGAVHPPARSTDSARQVPGPSVPSHPKPKPIQ